MSPSGADVMGVVARPDGVVTRCGSSAATSLSLSLSLCRESSNGKYARFGARNGARFHLLKLPRRGNSRGLCRSVCERLQPGGRR